MTEEQKNKIKEKFEKGNYDVVSYIVDNDLVTINLNSYETFCDEIIHILNRVRMNRTITEEEELYPYEELFANDFHTSIYRAIKRNEILDELPDDVLDKLKEYYFKIKNIGSAQDAIFKEEDNEKTK